METGGGGTTTTVNKTELPPWLEGVTKENLDMASQVAARPYQPYPGQTVAPFSPTQLASYNYAANTVGAAEPAFAAAQNAAYGVSGYTPQTTASLPYGAAGLSGLNQSANYQTMMTGDTAAGRAGLDGLDALSRYRAMMTGDTSAGRMGLDGLDASTRYQAMMTGDTEAGREGLSGLNATSRYEAERFPGTDLSGYLNPYTDAVINRTTDRVMRDRAAGANSIGDAAAKAGAFGGNRHAIQSAVYGAETQRNIGDLTASMNRDAFTAASGLATQDMNRAMQAAGLRQTSANALAGYGAADAARDLQAAGLRQTGANALAGYGAADAARDLQAAGLRQTSSNALAGYGAADANRDLQGAGLRQAGANYLAGYAANDANRDLQGASLNLQGANSLANIAQMAQNNRRQDAQTLENVGRAFTAQDQAYLNDAYKRWMAEWNYPIEQLNLRLAATSATPYGSTQTQIAPDNTTSNSFLGGLGAVGTAASGLAKLFALSDENMKTNKQKLGKDPVTGLDIYAYDYKSDVANARKKGQPMPPKRVGPMAQDIQKIAPEAIFEMPNGVKTVNLGFGPVRRRG